jgi:hypothetical protein
MILDVMQVLLGFATVLLLFMLVKEEKMK